jgi:hypothetical protein
VTEFLKILTEIYPQYLPLPLPPDHTPDQRQQWLIQEADRLATQSFDLSHELAGVAIQNWIQRHGQHPDYLTTVGLVNTARLTRLQMYWLLFAGTDMEIVWRNCRS